VEDGLADTKLRDGLSDYRVRDVKTVMVAANRRPQAQLHRTLVCVAFVVMALTSAACDKYEPTKSIEGVYRPAQCVTLQGIIPGGWLSHHQTIHPTVCQPIRVSELGIYAYGAGWSEPDVRAEVARLEFADAGVLVESDRLRRSGTFDYRERTATVGDWTRNNPTKAIMLVLVGLVVAVTIPRQAVARASRRRRERDQLEAAALAEAARLDRHKAEEAARKAEEAARPERHKAEEAARKAEEAARLELRKEWSRQLKSTSVDRLRFEYEKRQRSIQALQTKLARLGREREDMFDLNEEIMKSDYPTTDVLTRAFSIGDEIRGIEKEISTAEEEMTEIQQALDTKWD
ncbi:MAG: hypothetical protein ACREDR_47030, partial [Blastocatellia bacterium]